MQKNRGFTLIELSIVLVIIGLIVGGILVGKSLIETANIRSSIGQLEEFRTAVQTFRVKYNCLPGDCPNAVTFGLGSVAGPGDNGNGNGKIDSYGSAGRIASYWSNDQEMANFWYHLSRANLIKAAVTGYTSPYTKISDYAPLLSIANTYVWVFTNTAGQHEFFLSGELDAGNYTYTLSVTQAYAIDQKIDDTLPGTGNMRPFFTWIYPTNMANFTSDGSCVSVLGCTSNYCITPAEGNVYDTKGSWYRLPNNTYDASGTYGTNSNECALAILNPF